MRDDVLQKLTDSVNRLSTQLASTDSRAETAARPVFVTPLPGKSFRAAIMADTAPTGGPAAGELISSIMITTVFVRLSELFPGTLSRVKFSRLSPTSASPTVDTWSAAASSAQTDCAARCPALRARLPTCCGCCCFESLHENAVVVSVALLRLLLFHVHDLVQICSARLGSVWRADTMRQTGSSHIYIPRVYELT